MLHRSKSKSEEKRLQEFAARLQRLRPLLFSVSADIVGPEHAEDVIQDVYLRLETRVRTGDEVPDPLIVTAAKNLAIDRIRRERRQYLGDDTKSALTQWRPRDSWDFQQTSDLASTELLDDLTPLERKVFQLRVGQHKTHQEIAGETGRSHDAVRKIFQRAREKAQARTLCLFLRQGDYSNLNVPRISMEQAARAAELCRGDAEAVDSLFAAFERKELHRAIQNATWIMAQLYRPGSNEAGQVEQFFVRQLQTGDLYRGNKNYLAEALIDLNYRRYIYIVRRDFLLKLHELEDRVTWQSSPREEKAELRRPCIFEIKTIRPIGREVRPEEVRRMLRTYLSGEGSIDFRRCLAFQLLRLHPWEDRTAREVALWLDLELDQINALYVVKYLRLHGHREHPRLFDASLFNAIKNVAERWPRNGYLADSVSVLAARMHRQGRVTSAGAVEAAHTASL
jgi:RNA polymerase sigma factor (sigma-70 family)